jgi:murein DD-endopeptidase MepM/ murein hydrolase activator NlpD/tetratricopeptide (TPR) repeat protein
MSKEPQHSSHSHIEKLDTKTDLEWRNLADQVIDNRTIKDCSRSNETLLAAANQSSQSPTAPVFRLWLADNLASDGNYLDAIKAYDHCVKACQSVKPFLSNVDLISGSLTHKAQALDLIGDHQAAIETYHDLRSHNPSDKIASLQMGIIAERMGKHELAIESYNRIAASTYSLRTDDPAQLAKRALDRLNTRDIYYYKTATDLADMLSRALEDRDTQKLSQLVSKTHFAIGPVGGHTGFEDLELFDYFLKDLYQSRIKIKRMLLGTGEKRYLPTTDWEGDWFSGNVTLMITKAPDGWQWTGIALHNPNEYWLDRWKPSVIQTNDPLPFDLRAPWPKGQCFTAGGLWEFVAEAAVVAATWPFGFLVAEAYAASSCCGWGTRGYYYNSGPTHSDEDAFAIDFTRYRRYVPFDNESGGTPVLAVREGIVSFVRSGFQTGNSSTDNRVEIHHADPGNPSDTTRFTSKYLHLEGPNRIPVSMGMAIRVGTRLGLMDDTGNSVLDHLHFSIHDRQLPFPGASEGRSVRPTPMSGYTLGDSDSNKCVESNNIEYKGSNQMIYPKSYAGQNWLITPAALAVNESPPRSISDQKWMLVLSGVAHLNLKGNGSEWLRETVSLLPDILAPMNYAINKYNIPRPPTPPGYTLRFQVEQWVPHATLSSIYNKNHSVNSGFAVDVWRPNPFLTNTDVVTNAAFDKIFNGIQVDVAVSDIDAFFYRISYHISLIGKIRFGQPIIID